MSKSNASSFDTTTGITAASTQPAAPPSRPTPPPLQFEQLRLSLVGAVPDRTPDRGFYRELLTAARVSGGAHHVAWILYGRSDPRGRVKGCTESVIAADGGVSRAKVSRGIRELKRVGAMRQRRTRTKGGNFATSWYELNLGGGFTMRHIDARPCASVTHGTYVGLPYVDQDPPQPPASGGPARPAQAARPSRRRSRPDPTGGYQTLGRITGRCACGGFMRSTGHVGDPDRCPDCTAKATTADVLEFYSRQGWALSTDAADALKALDPGPALAWLHKATAGARA